MKTAEDIEYMSVYGLAALREAGPTEEQQRLMDKRRRVIADELQKKYSELQKKSEAHKAKVGEYVKARREERARETNPAANDTTETTGKHPDLRVPTTPRTPRKFRIKIKPRSKKELGRAMRPSIGKQKTDISAGTELGLQTTTQIGDTAKKALATLAKMSDPDDDPLQTTPPLVPSTPPLAPSTPPLAPGTPLKGTTITIHAVTPVSKQTTTEDPPLLHLDKPGTSTTGSSARDEKTEWSDDDSDRYSGSADDAGTVSDGSQVEPVSEADEGDVAGVAVLEAQQDNVLGALPWDVPLPTRPLMKFRPAAAPIHDEGNAPFFHRGFLDRGGPRNKVGIPFGYMLLRPKHVDIVVKRLTYATRQELSNFLHGRFPMGGVINKQSFSNAALPLAVFRHLPGKVTVTY